MKKNIRRIFIIGGIVILPAATLPFFSAFEAHVLNVTAQIENALSVHTTSIDFGTVFPQEKLNEDIEVSLSNSFLEEDRVGSVDYNIRQKPKCWNGDINSPVFGRVTENEQGQYICEDNGFIMLPLLCPYISAIQDNEPENDTGVPAFHNADEVATGRLDKLIQDIMDKWTIDLDVPCFKGQCAQDWMHQGWELPAELESELFGCDLWVEVNDISRLSDTAELECQIGQVRQCWATGLPGFCSLGTQECLEAQVWDTICLLNPDLYPETEICTLIPTPIPFPIEDFGFTHMVNLWNNEYVTFPAEGEFINISGYSEALLEFRAKHNIDDTDPSLGACQYAISKSNDGINPTYYSTFLYFSGPYSTGAAYCNPNYVIIPLDSDYIKIHAWLAGDIPGYLIANLYLK